MAIAIVSSTSQIGNSAVVSVPKPATVNNNDILIAFIGRKATTTGTLAFPAGWIKYELSRRNCRFNFRTTSDLIWRMRFNY